LNEAHVISVDPGAKTLGEVRINNSQLAKISRTLAAPCRLVSAPFKRTLNLLFGINRKVNHQFSVKILLLRIICGVSLLAVTAHITNDPADAAGLTIPAVAAVMVIAGISMVFGFFSRLVSLAAGCWFGYNLYSSLMMGNADLVYGMLTIVMIIFFVLGPGLYSIDRLMHKGLVRLTHLHAKKQENRVDYHAYSTIDRRIV